MFMFDCCMSPDAVRNSNSNNTDTLGIVNPLIDVSKSNLDGPTVTVNIN